MNPRSLVPAALILLVGITHAAPPSGAAFLDGSNRDVGILLAHGRDKHPGWLVVDPLRKGINRRGLSHAVVADADRLGQLEELRRGVPSGLCHPA